MAMKMSSKFGKMDASKNSYKKAMPKPSKAMSGAPQYGRTVEPIKATKMRQARLQAIQKRSQTMGGR